MNISATSPAISHTVISAWMLLAWILVATMPVRANAQGAERCLCVSSDAATCPPTAPEQNRINEGRLTTLYCYSGYGGGCMILSDSLVCYWDRSNIGGPNDSYLTEAVVSCDTGCSSVSEPYVDPPGGFGPPVGQPSMGPVVGQPAGQPAAAMGQPAENPPPIPPPVDDNAQQQPADSDPSPVGQPAGEANAATQETLVSGVGRMVSTISVVMATAMGAIAAAIV